MKKKANRHKPPTELEKRLVCVLFRHALRIVRLPTNEEEWRDLLHGHHTKPRKKKKSP
jgi:hypothetical protein